MCFIWLTGRIRQLRKRCQHSKVRRSPIKVQISRFLFFVRRRSRVLAFPHLAGGCALGWSAPPHPPPPALPTPLTRQPAASVGTVFSLKMRADRLRWQARKGMAGGRSTLGEKEATTDRRGKEGCGFPQREEMERSERGSPQHEAIHVGRRAPSGSRSSGADRIPGCSLTSLMLMLDRERKGRRVAGRGRRA